jgi:hypothetical protein
LQLTYMIDIALTAEFDTTDPTDGSPTMSVSHFAQPVRAPSGHVGPLSLQLERISGHAQTLPATDKLSLTRKRSPVQIQYGPPEFLQVDDLILAIA